jgi:hypothetical protein
MFLSLRELLIFLAGHGGETNAILSASEKDAENSKLHYWKTRKQYQSEKI